MRIKSYFADSVQEAIEKARVELGPDAMLMNSKKTDLELRALGAVEVVFGLPGQAIASRPSLRIQAADSVQQSIQAVVRSDAPSTAAGQFALELADLRRQIETVKRSIGRQNQAPSDTQTRNSAEKLIARLIAANISEDIAEEIANAAEMQALAWSSLPQKLSRDYEMLPSEIWELALAAEIDRRLQVSAELEGTGADQKIVMFVGSAGAGKTTSLIKLAVRFGLQARLPLHILSLDTLRVCGWESLAAYARIAGLSFDAVHNPKNLDQLIGQHSDKKIIFIDTPGFGPADKDDLKDLSQWAKRTKGVDVHLVMPATLRPSIVARTTDLFSEFSRCKLLLTRADEIESSGTLLDIFLRTGMTASYISNGPSIPEHIAPASKENLTAAVVAKRLSPAKQQAA